MIPNEVLTDELLQQAAAELTTALNDSLPPPDECQQKFSKSFEQKMPREPFGSPGIIYISGSAIHMVVKRQHKVGQRWSVFEDFIRY